jgi:hypothetical protein
MTKKKDLKRRVRERKARTGESYTAALRQIAKKPREATPSVLVEATPSVRVEATPSVRVEATPSVRVESAPSAVAEARAEGFRGDAAVSPKLRAMGDLRPLFARLRELLQALDSPACGPLFRGESAPLRLPKPTDALLEREFLRRVREGERGLGVGGRMAALSWNGQVVIAQFSIFPEHTPLLQLAILEEAGWPNNLLLLGIGR